ncbi:DUF5313 family protein [Williamsia sp.]|uniref:DUF5313 family protein n=1 Tax=Williamsia sp. TaxID=1872085 RepID=UPI001A2AF6BC|nr:DUF5313 family protein [Williamsia sp.]MBJ7289336.1 DUF5313 family protein [Williamsia sp.]
MNKRPNIAQWIAYAFGRRLPDDLREWVRNDLTGRHAFGRHLIRGMVPFVPIFVVFMLIPGPWWLRAEMVALGLSLALIYSAAYMGQNRRHRLEKHGLDPDLRPARQQQEKDDDQKRYEAIYGTVRHTSPGQLPHSNSRPPRAPLS